METHGKAPGSGMTCLRASRTIGHGPPSSSLRCVPLSAASGKIRCRRDLLRILSGLPLFLLVFSWQSQPLSPGARAPLDIVVALANLLPRDVGRTLSGDTLGRGRSEESDTRAFPFDDVLSGRLVPASVRSNQDVGDISTPGRSLRLRGEDGDPLEPPYAFSRPFSQHREYFSSGRHTDATAASGQTGRSSAPRANGKTSGLAQEVERQKNAFVTLQAAFAQLAQFHPDVYETSHVRGLIKWWQDPYIVILLCLSFGGLVAMGVWCLVASYK
ncbi:transmembrane protein [Cystoisospora suis]|uniref:Transmembrane protein n=1 Tax=Cystoisospora suis TaxID=483139 RepID=A0A2C6LEI6_9APIC|nr:transmembrane protein [Cystoisospora suis]